MKQTLRGQGGFTLIELVMVIVILGVLGATAIPKFVDLKADAQAAAIKGVAGAAEAASSINYATCSMVNNSVGARCVKIDSCDSAKNALSGGVWPEGYTVASPSGTTFSTTNGATSICNLNLSGYTPATQVTFAVVAAGN